MVLKIDIYVVDSRLSQSRLEPGARFSKLLVIIGPVKLFRFPFQVGVSKVLKII